MYCKHSSNAFPPRPPADANTRKPWTAETLEVRCCRCQSYDWTKRTKKNTQKKETLDEQCWRFWDKISHLSVVNVFLLPVLDLFHIAFVVLWVCFLIYVPSKTRRFVAVQRSAAPTLFWMVFDDRVTSPHRASSGRFDPWDICFHRNRSESIPGQSETQILVCFPRCVHLDWTTDMFKSY